MDPTTTATANRSIRTIISELEFLADSNLLSASQLSSIKVLLPSPTSRSSTDHSTSNGLTPASTSVSLSDKQQNNYYAPSPSPSPAPPPAYGAAKLIAVASAIYAYHPSDAGDLALSPNDRVQILEYMNADWAKGRNERTKQEGIFPRSYVTILDEKTASQSMGMVPPPAPQPANNYGNMPLAVSQSGGGGVGQPSKVEENGKKFGKKLGNAAIFGAGATIGSQIVSGIF